MPSSTSSSEGPAWGRAWLVAGGLVLLLLGGWELLWRGRGFVPAPRNDPVLWALARSRVSRAGPDAVVFVGSSRVQLGIDPEAFSEASGWSELYQLAIAMGAPWPVLRDLAEDPGFAGRVVVGINPRLVFDADLTRFGALRYLREYAALTPAAAVEARLRLGLNSALVSNLPPLHPARILKALTGGAWPLPQQVRVDAERFGRGDFDAGHARRAEAARAAAHASHRPRPMDPEALRRAIRAYAAAVRKIRARGGDVVFVQMPTDGSVRELEERLYPRSRYWDVFAREVGAVAIHFQDYPELQGYESVDGSHIQAGSAPAFSRALARLLVEAFAGGPGSPGKP